MPECPNCHEYYFGTPEKCPKCQHPLPQEKKLPPFSLGRVEGTWKCPRCGEFIDNSLRFCPHCRTERDKAAPTAAKNPQRFMIDGAGKIRSAVRATKFSHILGIIVAAALIIFSMAYPVPEKYVYVSSSRSAYDYSWSQNIGAEYLGGDAYNYQVEASLKAGYLTGVLAIKAITFVGGLLLLFLALYSRTKCQAIEEQTQVIAKMAASAETRGNNLEKLLGSSDQQSAALNALLSALGKTAAPDEEAPAGEDAAENA